MTQFLKLLDWIDINKINWSWLSYNPGDIHLLEQNPDKINWDLLSQNPRAIHLLEQNIDKINWKWLSRNPAIFTYDYEKIKNKIEQSGIKDELLAHYYRPENAHKFMERGDVSVDFVDRWK